jgi:hypothetical protein
VSPNFLREPITIPLKANSSAKAGTIAVEIMFRTILKTLESPIVNPEDVFSIPKSEKLSAITLVATFAIIAPPIPRNRIGIILFCFTYFVLIISFKLFLESFI